MRYLIAYAVTLLTLAATGQTLVLLDFEDHKVGCFPGDWGSKDEENMAKVYSIEAEDDNKFLHADAGGLSVTIGYDEEWGLAEYPILSWKWRAITLPSGTDERKKGGNDDVLGVYVVFGGWPIPKTIKYIWSEGLPVGTRLRSPYSSKTQMIVVESGKDDIGEWVEMERDVLKDYRRFFNDPEANPTAKGIAVLTDSDNTKTEAVGDYDDITILKTGGK